MPPTAKQISEDRFRDSNTYTKTVRYFSRKYGRSRGIIWRPIRGSPRVKGVHIINNRTRRQWDGINIYETGNKVYIYVVKATATEQKKR